MKNFKLGIIALTFLVLFMPKVNASSFVTDIVGDNTFTDTIKLYVEVDNISEFDGACNGLCGLVGTLEYSEDKIELVSVKALEGFELVNGKKIVLYKDTGVLSGTKVLELEFRNKSLNKNETTKISLKDIVASDGNTDISALVASKNIRFIVKDNNSKPSINDGTNNNNQSSSSTNTDKSTSNYLASLSLSVGAIDFQKNILNYDIEVDYDVKSIEVNAIAEDDNAIMTGLGKHDLKVGKNSIKVIVKGTDERDKVYTINVTRKEKNIVVNDKENVKESNYIVPIIIGLGIVIGALGVVFLVNKNNE